MSYLALAIAIVALVASVALPGPPGANGTNGATGATGPRGPAGPTGNGTVMAAGNMPLGAVVPNAACGSLGTFNLSITAPGPGTVVATATFDLGINHTIGYYDQVRLTMVSTLTPPSGGCPSGPDVFLQVPANASSIFGGTNRYFLPVEGTFGTDGGTATFSFVGGIGEFPTPGPDWAIVYGATLVLVYYPM